MGLYATVTPELDPIDWSGLKARFDLREIAAAGLPGADWSRDKVICPFHQERTPSMHVWEDHFFCFGCGASGDVFDWLMRTEGLTRPQAAKRLDPSIVIADDLGGPGSPQGASRAQARPKAEPTPKAAQGAAQDARTQAVPAWLDLEWQGAVDAIVGQSERLLWAEAGRDALGWLHSRGLDDATIRRYRLGFNPRDDRTAPIPCLADRDGKPAGIFVPRGITIPWLAPFPARDWSMDDPPDRWVGLAVRRLADPVDAPLVAWRNGSNPKTIAVKGSTRGYLYPQPEPWPHLRHRPCLIVEGEIDALLGEQTLGDQLPVYSVGGASTRKLAREARSILADAPLWLIATDHDQAGVDAALWWRRLNARKARRVLLPTGKDFAEFVANGGDPVAWLESIKAKPLRP